MTTTNDAIEEFIATKIAYDAAHAISSHADGEHKAAKAKLTQAMIEEDRLAVKLPNGLAFDVRQVFSIACNAQNEDELKDWLHQRYGDIEEFTKQALVKKSVADKIKEEIDAEQLDEFDVPSFVDLKTRPDVWCLGWAKFISQRN